MNHAAMVSFTILLGSNALAAQSPKLSPELSPDQKQTQTVIIQMPAGNSACPIAMHARHGVSGDLLAVGNSRPKGAAQLLHLTLTNGASRQITGGEVTVRGLTGKGHVTEALSAGDDSSGTALNLSVKFSAGANNDIFADLWVPGMTAVYSIELNSVTYADGSSWKLPTGTACRTIPDPIMLVGGH
jgi:hypothetical protein